MMHTLRSRFFAAAGIITLLLFGAIVLTLQFPRAASSGTTVALTGYAWSDTIGWISMNCAQTDSNTCATSNYNITMNANGSVSGYAWSDAIGWISAGGINGADIASCASGATSQINGSTWVGWLRALAGGTSQSGGWDGCISMSGSNANSTWGVTLNSSTGSFSGFAWGGDVVGWVDFSQVHTAQCLASTYCKNSQQVCVINPNTCGETCSTCQFTCQSGACYFPATSGTFTAVPSVVKTGGIVSISWNIQNVKNCTVTADNGDGPWNKGAGSDNAVVDSRTSSPIQKQTHYTLDCLELDSQTHYIKTITVNVLPAFREI